MGRQGKAKK